MRVKLILQLASVLLLSTITFPALSQSSTTITGTDGGYVFNSGLSVGQVYTLVETPPSPYVNTAAQALSQIDQTTTIQPNEIQVTVADPTAVVASYTGSVSYGTPPTADSLNYTVNGTGPAWFYCKTGTHCKSGMVFAVNPTAEKTYDAFKANAQGTGSSTNGTASASSNPSSTASGSTAPAATSKAAANGRATVGIGAVAAALLFGGVSAL